jgi:hypothetical protein
VLVGARDRLLPILPGLHYPRLAATMAYHFRSQPVLYVIALILAALPPRVNQRFLRGQAGGFW